VLIYVVFGRVHVITLGVCSRLTLLASKREPCNFAENRKKYAHPKVSTGVKKVIFISLSKNIVTTNGRYPETFTLGPLPES